MSPAKIVNIVGGVVVLAAALIPGIPYTALALAIVGLVVGYYVDNDHRGTFILSAVVLAGGANAALDSIPAIGMYLGSILTSLTALLAAAAVTIVVTVLYEHVTE